MSWAFRWTGQIGSEMGQFSVSWFVRPRRSQCLAGHTAGARNQDFSKALGQAAMLWTVGRPPRFCRAPCSSGHSEPTAAPSPQNRRLASDLGRMRKLGIAIVPGQGDAGSGHLGIRARWRTQCRSGASPAPSNIGHSAEMLVTFALQSAMILEAPCSM